MADLTVTCATCAPAEHDDTTHYMHRTSQLRAENERLMAEVDRLREALLADRRTLRKIHIDHGLKHSRGYGCTTCDRFRGVEEAGLEPTP